MRVIALNLPRSLVVEEFYYSPIAHCALQIGHLVRGDVLRAGKIGLRFGWRSFFLLALNGWLDSRCCFLERLDGFGYGFNPFVLEPPLSLEF
jgi:hypothetical protein